MRLERRDGKRHVNQVCARVVSFAGSTWASFDAQALHGQGLLFTFDAREVADRLLERNALEADLDLGFFVLLALAGLPLFHGGWLDTSAASEKFEERQEVLPVATRLDLAFDRVESDGQIYIHDTWHVAQGYTLVKDGQKEMFNFPTIGIGFSHEIIECHSCIRENKIESQYWSHQNSLELISILDVVRKQVGLKYPQD